MSDRDEYVFGVKNFLFSYKYPDQFVRSQWDKNQRTSYFYLIYRFVVMLYFLGWFIAEIPHEYKEERGPWWPIYLTHWAFVLFNGYLVITVIVILLPFMVKECQLADREKTPWWLKFHWILYIVTINATLAVCILYWALIFPYKPGEFDIYQLHTHCLNGVFLLVDIFIAAIPLRLLHFWVSSVFAVVYVGFSVIYYFVGGVNAKGYPYIYKSLDYGGSPISSSITVVLVTLVGLPLCHALFYGLFRLRLMIFDCCYPNRNVVHPDNDIPMEP